jgi:hypothetical protein
MFYSEDERAVFFENVGNHPSDYMVSQIVSPQYEVEAYIRCDVEFK